MFYSVIYLILAGVLGGFMNTLASSGSAITLPVMLFLGVPPSIANATNRLPIFLGSTTSVYSFNQEGLIDWGKAFKLTIPWLVGCGVGIYLSKYLSNEHLQTIIIIALTFAFFLLITNSRAMLKRKSTYRHNFSFKNHILFFLIGIWAGLIVLDCATLILFELILGCGMDLKKANPIKNYLLLILSFFSVIIFAANHNLNWTIGIILSIGSIMGSKIASNLSQNEKVKLWVFRFLILITAIEIVHLVVKIYYNFDFFPLNKGNTALFNI